MRTDKQIEGTQSHRSKWQRTITITQLILAGMVFLAEAATCIVLYATDANGIRAQKLGPSLLRSLLLTTLINFCVILIGRILVTRVKQINMQRFILIVTTEAICINVSLSHYNYAIVFGVFAIPLVLSILYEDLRLANWTVSFSVVGVSICIVARATDPYCNRDIWIEAIIAYLLIAGVYLISRMCINILNDRRNELDTALVNAEKAKYLDKVEKMSVQMMSTLVQLLDAKDSYTNGHSFRVSEYSVKLGEALGLSKDELERVRQEALLHDIGKIGIPDSVLNKPDSLSEIEYDVMKSHTSVGSEILKNMVSLPDANRVAASHHERYDGTGYPLHMKGDMIPRHARIVAIADAYDAMNSDRIYRKCLSKEQIRERLLSERGLQFDPEYLDKFVSLMDNDQLIATMSDGADDENRVSLSKLTEELAGLLGTLAKEDAASVDEAAYIGFAKIYEFIKRIKTEYHQSFMLLMITMKEVDGHVVTSEDLDEARKAIEISIKKNITSYDVYLKYSKMQHVVILTHAGVEKMSVIVNKIFLDFYKQYEKKNIEVSYEVGE